MSLITIHRQHLLNALAEREVLAQISLLRQLIGACEQDIEKLDSLLIENTQAFGSTHKALNDAMPAESNYTQDGVEA